MMILKKNNNDDLSETHKKMEKSIVFLKNNVFLFYTSKFPLLVIIQSEDVNKAGRTYQRFL